MKQKGKYSNLERKINIIILIVSLFLIISFMIIGYNYKVKSFFYKTILYTDYQISKVSIIEQKANSYYNEASYSYEKEDYKGVESNCRLARGYYSDASQRYREIKSEIQQLEIEDELINIKKEMLELSAEIHMNMFEACEHFESAARYYDVYYNDLTSSESNYDMGTSEIDAMNEKIRLHDKNIRKYNDLLADSGMELKKRLK